MSTAWMSARAGRAIVVSDSEHYLLEVGRQVPPQPCAPGQLNNLRALASDLAWMEAGAFPFPEVKEVLEKTWREQSALDLLLMALDGSLEADLREDAGRIAARLLAHGEVHTAVRRRLLSTPLPEEADVERIPKIERVEELAREALQSRELVSVANRAWGRVFGESGFGYSEREELKELCIREGGFAALVSDLRLGRECCFSKWLQHLHDGLVKRHVQDLLQKWQTVADRLRDQMKPVTLWRSVGLEEELGAAFSQFFEQVPLEELPPNALDLSEKARVGIINHTLSSCGADLNLRRRVLDRIGVGRV